jgi:hypothetical protein
MSLYNIWLDQAKLLHQHDKVWPGRTLVQYIPEINQIIKEKNLSTILDYGCGKARHHDPSWNADKYDPAVPEYSKKPDGRYDLVICTDVLEHIPQVGLDYVIDDIFNYSDQWVFLSVCCRKAKQLLPNGYNAHATIESQKWWKEKLAKYSNYTLKFSK